jgi:hypothetical protein
MQIIAELEPTARGIYTGAFGRLGPALGLDVDLAMTIRTAVCAGDRLRLGVGGGIVADSVVDAEWAESRLKARAFEAALRSVCDDTGCAGPKAAPARSRAGAGVDAETALPSAEGRHAPRGSS